MPSITETSPLLEGRRATATHTNTDTSPSPTSHAQNPSEAKTLVYACVLTLFFFFVELIGGYIAHSLAIMSDAAHLLSDVAGLAISLIAVWVSRLPANSRMSFGFARAEVLGAFVSVFFIWALTAVLVIFAIYRLFNPTPVNGHLMLFLGCVGLGVNIVLGFVLGHSHAHGHGHGHGHGHAHAHGEAHGHLHSNTLAHEFEHSHTPSQLHTPSHTPPSRALTQSPSLFDSDPPVDLEHGNIAHSHHDRVDHHNDTASCGDDDDGDHDHDDTMPNSHQDPRSPCQKPKFSLRNFLFGTDIESINVRAAYLHVLGDALQSVGVIIAAIVICIDNRLSFVDPICTLLFAALVVMTTAGLARDTIAVLMEATPPSIKLDEIYHRLLEIEGVRRVGDLHVWSISANRPALSVHLYQKANTAAHDVLKETRQILASEFKISHATVQINCEATECCDEKVYLGAEAHLKNCVNYQNLTMAGTSPVTAIQISSNVPAGEYDQETVTQE